MKQTNFLFSPVSHLPNDSVYVSALYSLKKSQILNTSGPKLSTIVKPTTTFHSLALMEAEPEGSQPFSPFILVIPMYVIVIETKGKQVNNSSS